MMRRFIDKTIATAIFVVAIFAITTGCSSNGERFKIDARFLNMNQANFYVYSPDGAINGIDTIGVQAGRFTYEREVVQEGIVVIVFPNYATMPVFVKPGASISIEANAAHLKEMEITGTADNKLYTEWRKNNGDMSPLELKKQAETFINDHPESAVSRWLVQQYYILAPQPDYKKARTLLKKMLTASENNIQVAKMLYGLDNVGDLTVGSKLPRFSAKDINGNPVLNGKYQKGSAIICLWASWSNESMSMLRQIAARQNYGADSLKIDNVLTICLDPDIKQCRRMLKNSSAESLTTICDTMMWDSPLLRTLGFNNLPDNIRLKDGKVTGRYLPASELLKKQ